MEEDGPERKLAAILAADVVGFSRMMGADEAGTLARLASARAEVIDPLLASHRGRIFKVMGDGLLVEFMSAVLALRCAVAIQTRLGERNEALPERQRIVLRIGLHQGDVVVEGSDLLGDGVNVAARLEPLAEPGGICISGRVREDAAGRIAIAVEDMGEQALKNIARPMRTYQVRLGVTPSPDSIIRPLPDALRAFPPLPAGPSIAVMPFGAAGSEAGFAAMVDGLTEDIVGALRTMDGLHVAPLRAAQAFRGKRLPAHQIGQELGVGHLIEGSVRQAGQRLRASIQLVEAETGDALWADRQDGTADELFDLHDRVVGCIVAVIKARLLPLGPAEASGELLAVQPANVAGEVASEVASLPLQEPAEEAPEERTAFMPALETHHVLMLEDGPALTREFVVGTTPLTIGRVSTCDVILTGSNVSRTHCRVELAAGFLTVIDLHSTNGTFVDGQRITGAVRLAAGGTLRIGGHTLRYDRRSSLDIDGTQTSGRPRANTGFDL